MAEFEGKKVDQSGEKPDQPGAGVQFNLELAKISLADLIMDRLSSDPSTTEAVEQRAAKHEDLIVFYCDQVVGELIGKNPDILLSAVLSMKNEDMAITPFLLSALANHGAEGMEIIKAATTHTAPPLALCAVCEVLFKDQEQGLPLLRQFLVRTDLDTQSLSTSLTVIERLNPQTIYALQDVLKVLSSHPDSAVAEQADALLKQGNRWVQKSLMAQLRHLLGKDNSIPDTPEEARSRAMLNRIMSKPRSGKPEE